MAGEAPDGAVLSVRPGVLMPSCLHGLLTPLSSLVFKFGAHFRACDALPVSLCSFMTTLK